VVPHQQYNAWRCAQPDFDIDSLRGKLGEDEVARLRQCHLDGTIEVKRDSQAARTKNIYVERRCLKQGEWTDSGIKVTKADSWCFVLHSDGNDEASVVITLPTPVLLGIAKRLYYVADNNGRYRHRRECTTGSHPTKGVLIPFAGIVVASLT